LKQTRETYNLRHRYGIEAQQKNDMIFKQNNVCAICREPFKNKLDTNIDHCHTTKKLRGVLCRLCNTGLGKFKDSPELLRFAALYIEYHAKQKEPTPVPTGSHQESQDNTTHGAVHGAGPWEDGDGAHHHLGGTEGDNPHRGAETSGGVSMGSGMSEMGASETLQGSEGDGDTEAKADSVRKFIKHLCDQSREFSVAVRAGEEVRLPNHRREQPIQRSEHEKVQSTQEAPKDFQEEVDIDWDAVAARFTRPMEPSWYTGFGPEAGDEPNKV
jgi:hypothetical protein